MARDQKGSVRPVTFAGDALVLIDQRRLPGRLVRLRIDDHNAAVAAIRDMVVRGAPAIGIAGGYAVVLAAQAADRAGLVGHEWRKHVADAAAGIARARPTAVNLAWAVGKVAAAAAAGGGTEALRAEADAILAADVSANRAIGREGSALLPEECAVLTHCNAGALATGGFGTALGVVRAAYDAGKLRMVFATETRPLQQGMRLTAWELRREGIPVTVIADSAAAWLMRCGEVQAVVVGADRIARNGDVANKIGTYALAIAACRHRIPFYVAAPVSTLDPATRSGTDIIIEERSAGELTEFKGRRLAPLGVSVVNPAFDITPAELITAIITESGVLRGPDVGRIMESLESGPAAERTLDCPGNEAGESRRMGHA